MVNGSWLMAQGGPGTAMGWVGSGWTLWVPISAWAEVICLSMSMFEALWQFPKTTKWVFMLTEPAAVRSAPPVLPADPIPTRTLPSKVDA